MSVLNSIDSLVGYLNGSNSLNSFATSYQNALNRLGVSFLQNSSKPFKARKRPSNTGSLLTPTNK